MTVIDHDCGGEVEVSSCLGILCVCVAAHHQHQNHVVNFDLSNQISVSAWQKMGNSWITWRR